jgi:preprotein translocase subunit SecE
MAEALKMKEESIRRSGGNNEGGNALSGVTDKIAEYPRRWRAFLHEVRVEMRQVTWPTRHEVIVTTWVVMVTVAFFGVYFFGVDSAASWIVQHIIKLFGH